MRDSHRTTGRLLQQDDVEPVRLRREVERARLDSARRDRRDRCAERGSRPCSSAGPGCGWPAGACPSRRPRSGRQEPPREPARKAEVGGAAGLSGYERSGHSGRVEPPDDHAPEPRIAGGSGCVHAPAWRAPRAVRVERLWRPAHRTRSAPLVLRARARELDLRPRRRARRGVDSLSNRSARLSPRSGTRPPTRSGRIGGDVRARVRASRRERRARRRRPVSPRWTAIDGAAHVWNEVPSAARRHAGRRHRPSRRFDGSDQDPPETDPLVARPSTGDPAPAAKKSCRPVGPTASAGSEGSGQGNGRRGGPIEPVAVIDSMRMAAREPESPSRRRGNVPSGVLASPRSWAAPPCPGRSRAWTICRGIHRLQRTRERALPPICGDRLYPVPSIDVHVSPFRSAVELSSRAGEAASSALSIWRRTATSRVGLPLVHRHVAPAVEGDSVFVLEPQPVAADFICELASALEREWLERGPGDPPPRSRRPRTPRSRSGLSEQPGRRRDQLRALGLGGSRPPPHRRPRALAQSASEAGLPAYR